MDIKDRLKSNSSINHETGCIEWNGALMKKGYGHINYNGKVVRVHRLAYELSKGTIPDGKFVCHSCDNRKCINPDHLFVGSVAENQADMVSKNRQTLGEKNGMSKLTTSDVLEIKSLLKIGMIQRQIANIKGVSRELISQISRGKRWGHIEGEHYGIA